MESIALMNLNRMEPPDSSALGYEVVGMREWLWGTATWSCSKASRFLERLLEYSASEGRSFEVSETGCIGVCFDEPLVEVHEDGAGLLYGRVTPELAMKLAEGTAGDEARAHIIMSDGHHDRHGVLDNQFRVALARCGLIDPASLDQYVAAGGYVALAAKVPDRDDPGGRMPGSP
ncbi:MAG: (2Fe-2S) ferredoxin domain-containing protein [Rhodopseudomonas palustris]|nr:(2Fe-2S) ferredoxin domain-containing protein [Rhodopseudomonas palustris]